MKIILDTIVMLVLFVAPFIVAMRVMQTAFEFEVEIQINQTTLESA